jgi:hypothetical protein
MENQFYKQKISVVVIQDCGMESRVEAVERDLWMMASDWYIPQSWLERVKGRLPGHIVQTEEHIMCWEWVSNLNQLIPVTHFFYEQLLIFYALETHSGGPCQLEFMKWKDYKQAVLKGAGERWEWLQDKDLIVGGLALTVDFM